MFEKTIRFNNPE